MLLIPLFGYPPALGKGQTVISEEELMEKQANRIGASVELSPRGTNSPKPASNKGYS